MSPKQAKRLRKMCAKVGSNYKVAKKRFKLLNSLEKAKLRESTLMIEVLDG